ncbi:uncharacterized protein SPPG_02293 [Spizellomyces punctatus DAOM BR117]|uniref:TRAF3-interacting protein 1 n=1 Tax=Spizellomyces punctatus (strain DAOM BR117) TaxID=645134 RepID=A0A0L0HQK7_SPIPD|nr:uncharacterized protein SPPG_02293 [Spizellomyces punctatus DAOM BR117]KND03240.1 hypothetical protein SPPG_02293 [Spizellomyces punctatus DAOM BR117]|eukprot:XP_016611279.1 hypothetical protein SPPG_02293 [Spizellomyces punctatus DAOM BR117]
MSTLEDAIKKTADILGRIIKKPPLTPKLLSKPPFRYLHDLISEIINTTEFAKGLYDEIEMNSENVKEKDAKIAYLTKIIDCVGIATGVEVKASPLKIVAGLEPEETNFLLQLLGKAVLKKVDSSDAVKRVLVGEHQGKRRGSKESLSAGRSTKAGDSGSLSDLQKGKSDPALDARPQTSRGARDHSAQKTQPQHQPLKPQTPPATEPSPQSPQSQFRSPQVSAATPPPSKPSPQLSSESRLPPSVEAVAPSQGRALPQPALEEAVPEESVRTAEMDLEDRQARVASTPRRMRPASARPAPPRQRAPEVVLEEVPKDLPAIFTERKQDDDDQFVVIAHDDEDVLAPTGREEGPLADEKHGGLVRTILQTKQELEGTKEVEESKDRAKTAKDRTGGKKEIEALRNWIQALTRSTNPLGKTMDYMQEDIDSMNRELEMWRKERQKYQSVLDMELSTTQEGTTALETQLRDIENAIDEQLEKISSAKAVIIQNDELIQRLLRGITKGGL